MARRDEYSRKQPQFNAIYTPYWKDRTTERRTRHLQTFQDVPGYQARHLVLEENGKNSSYMEDPTSTYNIPASPAFNQKSRKRDRNINLNISVHYPTACSKISAEPNRQAQLATQIVLNLLPLVPVDPYYGYNEFDFADIYASRDDTDSESAPTEQYSHINNINVHTPGQDQVPRSPSRSQGSEDRAAIRDNSLAVNILRVTANEHTFLESLSSSPQLCVQ